MSGKSKRPTKRRRRQEQQHGSSSSSNNNNVSDNSGPLDLKNKVDKADSAGFGLQAPPPSDDDDDDDNNDDGEHHHELSNGYSDTTSRRQSGVYGDGDRSIASRHIHRSTITRSFPLSRSSRSRRSPPKRASKNRQDHEESSVPSSFAATKGGPPRSVASTSATATATTSTSRRNSNPYHRGAASISRSRNPLPPPRPTNSAFVMMSSSSAAASVRSSGTASRRSTTGIRIRSRSRGRTIQQHVSHDHTAYSRPAVHIVCAIGENLARETCIASLDAGSPMALQVTKQGNGETTYAETMAYLEMLQPHEILLNEGRKNSPLARKIVQRYEQHSQQGQQTAGTSHTWPSMAPTASRAAGAEEEQTVVKFIPRSCFDQTKGAELLRRLARTDTFDPALVEEYILLSSTHAVLHYTQQALGASFSRKCLTVSVNSGGGDNNRMVIDRSTLLQLELLTNAKTGKTRNSLVSSIDCTKTTVGTRLLRTTLMAPPCRSDTIHARLDLVDSFLQDEEFFYAVLEHLKNLPAVDKMLTDIAVVPKLELSWKKNSSGHTTTTSPVVTARLASKGIAALVCIKSTLGALPALVGVLQDHLTDLEEEAGGGTEQQQQQQQDRDDTATAYTGRSSLLVGLGGGPPASTTDPPPQPHYLLRAILQALSQPQLEEIRNHVSEVFTESTKFSRNANAMRHQECFALKSKDNGMMEILRKAFLANVDDIYKKADEYAEIHGMHVSVRYTTSTRGYYLSIPADMAAGLPNIFIQPIKSGNHIYCTTEEVHSLNIRAQDNVQDLLLMTYERIQEVLADARSKYDALASLSDAIALLDLCHGFADKVTLSKLPWSRPVLVGGDHDDLNSHSNNNNSSSSSSSSSSNAILIRNGRYGIDVSDSYLSSAEGPREIIPNDTYASENKPFTVISGINGSGKSTYLKQIAIIVLLAHCGSYVPAEQASIPLRNRLCARMGTADDQENNISSFMLEMKETAFICSNATDKSLILLDELGRATSNEDGVTIAWAVSEFLLQKGAMTFFVTHFPQLCQLSQVYPSVQNQHLKASISSTEQGGGTRDIRYTHKLTTGRCTASPDYGVEMATSCGWPADVVEDARQIKRNLRENLHENNDICQDPDAENGADAASILARKSFLKKLCRKLLRTVQKETSVVGLRSKLQGLHGAVLQNSDIPIADIKGYLERHLLVESSSRPPIEEDATTVVSQNIASRNERLSAGNIATSITAGTPGNCCPRVSAPDESSSSDDSSLTSNDSSCLAEGSE